MNVFKTLFTFTTGIAAGLAISYYADPKGSQKKLRKLEKEVKKTRKTLDKRVSEYKGNYNQLIENYAGKSKELLEQAKDVVNGAKQSVKA